MNLIPAVLLSLLLPALAWSDDTFPLVLPECPAKLERRTVEAQVILVRTECPLSLSSLATLLDAGLNGLFPDHHLPVRGIYLGRVMDYPQWSTALAKAAAQSPAWNSKRGRPSKAGENDNYRVRQLLNGPAYPRELKAVFAQYALTACIGDVEKVLIFKAGEIFTDPGAMPHGVSRQARLPVDGQIWLAFRPLGFDCGSGR